MASTVTRKIKDVDPTEIDETIEDTFDEEEDGELIGEEDEQPAERVRSRQVRERDAQKPSRSTQGGSHRSPQQGQRNGGDRKVGDMAFASALFPANGKMFYTATATYQQVLEALESAFADSEDNERIKIKVIEGGESAPAWLCFSGWTKPQPQPQQGRGGQGYQKRGGNSGGYQKRPSVGGGYQRGSYNGRSNSRYSNDRNNWDNQ